MATEQPDPPVPVVLVVSPGEAGSEVHRPWGSYRSVDVGHHHQVKRLIVEPGHRLSLQRHRRRAEHWVVVQGTATITRDEESRVLHENESVFIPVGCVHRLENGGPRPLHLVEVQVGDYLGEDDIERLADDYGRSPR
jgi:mannose-1-phosphate guanylyltransferase/mannose-6-phosphate isomerase